MLSNLMLRLLPFLMMLPVMGQAQPLRLQSSAAPSPLGHGATLVVKRFPGAPDVEMKLVIFDEEHCQLRVVANTERDAARSLAKIGRDEKALAVCNGGYFDPGKLTPAGLEIADGSRSGKFDPWGWVGALSVEKDKAALVWQEEFRDSPDITQFIQCSPWLVSEGRVVPLPPGDDPRNLRTFILTDGEGRWAIGICNRIGLLELARLLITPGIVTELKVKRALNFDGGPSTGLWCRHADGRELEEKPGWAVRNAIVVVPRAQ